MNCKNFSLLIVVLFSFAGCGGGSGSSDPDIPTTLPGSPTTSTGSPTTFPGAPNTSSRIPHTVPYYNPTTIPAAPSSKTTMGTVTVSTLTLPGNNSNARERESTAHYIGRTHDSNNRDKILVPMRSYFASCKDSNGQEKMYVSMTLQTGALAIETAAAVIETGYDSGTNKLIPTGDYRILPQCKYGHGIAASTDCSRVAMLCQTEYQSSIRQAAEFKKNIVAGTLADEPDITSDEIWLLEWNDENLTDSYDAYLVNNRSTASSGMSANSLIYREDDPMGPSYAFASIQRTPPPNTHYSSSLNIIDRTSWTMNYLKRGWEWKCLSGHTINSRAFYHEQADKYGAICSSDYNGLGAMGDRLQEIGVKYENERSDSTGGVIHYVSTSNGWLVDGGAHKAIGIDKDTALAILVGVPFVPHRIPEDMLDKYMENMVRADMEKPPEDQILKCLGSVALGYQFESTSGCGYAYPASDDSLSDIEACLQYFSEFREKISIVSIPNCYFAYLRSYITGTWQAMSNQDDDDYSKPAIFSLGNKDLEPQNKSQIGLARVDANGDLQTGTTITWVANNGQCMLSNPRLVDMKNGRYLLGYAKFACYIDNNDTESPIQRKAGKKILIPKKYYLAEIDAYGNVLAGPKELSDSNYGDIGWGGIDEMVYLGDGKVGWAYIPDPTYETVEKNKGVATPQHKEWLLMTYKSAYVDPNASRDTDDDGLMNNIDPDDDNDGVKDGADDLPLDASDTVDTDGDGVGNTVDTDDDGDTIPDAYELERGFSPLKYLDAYDDIDGDGASSLSEYNAGTDPHDPNSYP